MNVMIDNAVVLMQALGVVAMVGGLVLSMMRKQLPGEGVKSLARY